jgi:hypothetical protein
MSWRLSVIPNPITLDGDAEISQVNMVLPMKVMEMEIVDLSDNNHLPRNPRTGGCGLLISKLFTAAYVWNKVIPGMATPGKTTGMEKKDNRKTPRLFILPP